VLRSQGLGAITTHRRKGGGPGAGNRDPCTYLRRTLQKGTPFLQISFPRRAETPTPGPGMGVSYLPAGGTLFRDIPGYGRAALTALDGGLPLPRLECTSIEVHLTDPLAGPCFLLSEFGVGGSRTRVQNAISFTAFVALTHSQSHRGFIPVFTGFCLVDLFPGRVASGLPPVGETPPRDHEATSLGCRIDQIELRAEFESDSIPQSPGLTWFQD